MAHGQFSNSDYRSYDITYHGRKLDYMGMWHIRIKHYESPLIYLRFYLYHCTTLVDIDTPRYRPDTRAEIQSLI